VVRLTAEAGKLSVRRRVQNGSGAYQASYPICMEGALSMGVNRPRVVAYYLLRSSAGVKNAWSYTSTPTIRLHIVVLSSKQRKFTFAFYYYYYYYYYGEHFLLSYVYLQLF